MLLQGWVVIAVALGYIGLLFLVASYGDRMRRLAPRQPRAAADLSAVARDLLHLVDVLRLGRPRLAHRLRLPHHLYRPDADDRPFGYPLIVRIVRLAKAQNITSIADFIAARYGKSQAVAATVALIAIVGTIPYIALQLKAVSSSLGTILAQHRAGDRRRRSRCSATSRCSSRCRWRPSRCCSAPATSTPPSTRTA